MRLTSAFGNLLLITLVAVGTALPQKTNPGTAPPSNNSAVSAGTTIGTALRTAISTAFPPLGTILNAIWPTGKDNTNQKKSDATNATMSLQTKSVQGQNQINAITNDLDAVSMFLSSCVAAEPKVIEMRTTIRGKTGLTPADTLLLTNDSNDVKSRLAKVGSAQSAVNSVSDRYIQTTLQAVIDASSSSIQDIENDIKAPPAAGLPRLADDLSTLDSQLSAVNALTGLIIQDVSVGLKAAKSQAAGGQGSHELTDPEKRRAVDFDSFLQKQFPKRKKL